MRQLDEELFVIRKNGPNLQLGDSLAARQEGIARELAKFVRLRVFVASTIRTVLLFSYQNGSTRRCRFGVRFFVSFW